MMNMRGSSELISTVILVAVVLGMALALWGYAQSSATQLKSSQTIQNMIAESSTKITVLRVFSQPPQYVFQVSYSDNSTIYAALLGIKGSSFIFNSQDQILIPYAASGFANLSDSTQWISPPASQVSSSSVMIQPIYSSDSSYYSLDLRLGGRTVSLYRLDFSSSPAILLQVNASGQYTEVLVFFIQIEDKYWAFAYYYL